MDKNEFRYQLYIKRAVLQAHIASIDDTIYQIETPWSTSNMTMGDYRVTEEDCFSKYLKQAEDRE